MTAEMKIKIFQEMLTFEKHFQKTISNKILFRIETIVNPDPDEKESKTLIYRTGFQDAKSWIKEIINNQITEIEKT